MIHESIADWFRLAHDANLTLDAGAVMATTLGCVRETNQDRLGILQVSTSVSDFTCACLCDGMGGMHDGDLAAIGSIAVFFSEMVRERKNRPTARLGNALQAANRYVATRYPGAGSTLAAVLLEESRAFVLNVGDSRIYGINETGTFARLTTDDTMKERYGAENNGLLQYVGLKKDLKPDIREVDPNYQGFIIASDGYYSVGEGTLSQLYRTANSSSTFAKRSIELSKWIGGYDNASFVLIPTPRQRVKSALIRADLSVYSPSGRMKIEWNPEENPPDRNQNDERFRQRQPSDLQGALDEKKDLHGTEVKKNIKPRKPKSTTKRASPNPKAKNEKRDGEDQQFVIGFDSEDKA